METNTPTINKMFLSLFRADLTTQWRNRRASIMSLVVPIIILVSWRSVVDKLGGAFALSSCITIGLVAVGLMGYANTVARDRERGIFQRLRVTPAPTSLIMLSRLAVQLIQMACMTIIVFIAGYYLDHIVLTAGEYIFTTLASMLCGAVYLGLGQAVVGLISSAETVNATTRFIYIPLIVVGAIGELNVLGSIFKSIVAWSPYGTVKVVLLGTMQPQSWSTTTWVALLVSIAYAVIFGGIGIKWFKWNING